ncbi:hypothetical protein BDL97_03G127000 [Sphagnum fallax]|nr:hypothetical protein BDL97_03G127000 [Sphagnum fallax]KAH8968425.1 hypothetical protein BDL97_03G127000 [Sphagnum fallax]
MGWIVARNSTMEEDAEQQQLLSETPEPRDEYNAAYSVFFALGVGLILPWNAFISAVDYFQVLYPDAHTDRVFALAYMFPCLFTLVYLTFYCRKFSASSRINGGLTLFLAAIVLIPIVDQLFITGSQGSQATQYVTVGAGITMGIANAIMEGSLVGVAGELPERYMQAFVAGTAGSGVIASVLRVITKGALPQTVQGLRLSANIYFCVTAIFLSICILAYNLVYKLPIMVYYTNLKLDALESAVQNNADDQEHVAPKSVTNSEEMEHTSIHDRIVSVSKMVDPVSYWWVWSQIKWLAISATIIYLVTLSIFPGYITEDVHSAYLGNWYPVLLILSYNVFDLLGKMLTSVYIIKSQKVMISGSFARLVFFPLFYMVLHGPAVLRTEVLVFILTSLLGVTNGYFTSVHMIVAPKTVSLLEAETAGIIMVLFFISGLLLGSLLSWVWII